MPWTNLPLSILTSSSVANGYSFALALVVLLQYFHSLSQRSNTQVTSRKFKKDVEGLSQELLQLSRERGLQRLENQILREVLTYSDCQKAIGHLLRRFIVNPDDSFGLFMPLDPASEMPHQSRGLSEESIANLKLEHAVIQQLREHGAVVWETPTIANCPLYCMLAPADRRKARRLYVIGIGDTNGLLGVVLASALLPIAGSQTEQVDLTTRLMSSIAPNLRQTLELERQSVQLRCTREMLELRSLTDGKVSQPSAMLEKFLSRLGQMVEAERTSLFLLGGESALQPKCSVRCGLQLQNGLQVRWNEHEERLAQIGVSLDQLTILDAQQLCRNGIDTLIGTAVVMPLNDSGRRLGVVTLSRRNGQGFSATQRQLLCWAAESLSHTLERAMSFLAIEQQARQDGLTGLPNRRTFDEQLHAAITDVRTGQITECSLLLLDLDRFKLVNDVHGHQMGDAVLREAAHTIRDEVSKLRSNDQALPARYGGEEMALLLPGIGINGAERIAESLRRSIEKQHQRANTTAPLAVTTSIGVASCPLNANSAESLIQAADTALYRAKSEGRNRVQVSAESY